MPAIATIGFFDGVHKGHRYLFEQLHRYASEYDERPLIFTFLQHPRTVLAKLQGNDDFCPQLLTTTDEREQLLGQYGDVHFFDFAEVQPLTAAQFLDYLADRWKVRRLLMGYNHRFGSDGLSDEQYAAVAQRVGIRVLRAEPYCEGEQKPSSTAIRNLLAQGNIVEANRLLGYEYMLTGRVVHGRMIGRQIGFPTANIVPASDKLIPAPGVYKAVVSGSFHQPSLADSGIPALVNIGTNPTVGNTHQTIEVHIPDFSGDLYNQSITLHFTERLREERHFASLDELKAQIQKDYETITSSTDA